MYKKVDMKDETKAIQADNLEKVKAQTPETEKVKDAEPISKAKKPRGRHKKEDPEADVKKDVANALEYFMARHHFANGWKREIREIVKPVLG